jgi:hypothetical protein
MKPSSPLLALALLSSNALFVKGVDIGSFEEDSCDFNHLVQGCTGQAERICCEFASRLTSTWSVGWRGLSEGDIGTWFHPAANGAQINHCATRRAQAMAGAGPGILCITANDGLPLVSNDGANW